MVLEMAPRFAGFGQVAAEDKGRQSRKGRQEGYGVGPMAFEYRGDYRNYKEVNSYIHSLNSKERERFQKVLISQKATLDKKYGVGRDTSIDKYDSADDIAIKNSDRLGVYANPLRIEEYFDDDAYYYWDHIYYFHGIIYVGTMYYLYRRRIQQK